MILEIDNVELSYSGKTLLRGIYLKAETSKITAILGRNGSGKSCLMHIIFGSIKPKYCLLRIDGAPILKPLYTTGKVGLMAQDSFIPGHINLKTIFKLYKLSWKHFISVFPEITIQQHSKPKNLSLGERRLIECYLIIKGNYDIILLDEPFSHISPRYVRKISQLIKDEKKNKIIILSDHSVEDVLEISDKVYLLKNGCTLEIENKGQLYDHEFLSSSSYK